MEFSQIQLANDVLLIQFQGENLDASNVREFRTLMQSVLKKNHRIVFDMQQMKFVDSSGLGALISCLRETNAQKGDFRLCSLSRSVSALFELMRMHRVFNIHDTPEMAAQSFA